jgi:hypothetical protein
MSDIGDSIAFVERATLQRAAHCREQAAKFRSLAEVEPLASLRRRLIVLARDYEDFADRLEFGSQSAAPPRRTHPHGHPRN